MESKQDNPQNSPDQPTPPQPPVPPSLDFQLQQAMAHHRAGRLAQAEALYRQILQINPNHLDAMHLVSVIASQLGQHSLAVELADRAILVHPDVAELHATRGNALAALQQYSQALNSFDNAVHLKPDFVAAHCDRGNMLYALQRYSEAAESFDRAIRLDPNFAGAHSNHGIALNGLGQYQAAIESFDCAIQLQPAFAEAHHNRAIALYSLRQYSAALDSLDRAILHRPNYPEACSVRGSTLNELQQYQAALDSFDQAIRLNLSDARTHSNRANALHALHQYQAAIESCDRALHLNPDFAEAWNNRGNSHLALQQHRQAQHDFNQSIRLKPDFAEAYNNLGTLLFELRQYQAALEAIDRAIQLQPDFAKAYNNRGNVLQHMDQHPRALESFTKAMRLDPDCDYVGGTRMHVKRSLCDWEDLEAEWRQVETRIDWNKGTVIPFLTLAISNSPALQKKASEMYVRDRYPAPAGVAPIHRRARPARIRIGYFSADYYNHATSYLMAELFERHDRNQFEILGFSFGTHGADEMSQRVVAAMDRFVDVQTMPDRDIAQLSRDLEVDIAVDLKGFTKGCRPGIFAQRAAPIQVNYLGYPGTMGADYIDYLIADSTIIPESAQPHYSEKIVYLPDTYQANDSHRPISAELCARADQGLPETGFVYCCFNNANKLTAPVFDIWMRILAQVQDSVLWLFEENPLASANLRKEAARRGIAPERLVFARHLPLAKHLARERLADLFLDTFPYNAHTTASDALRVGLPVLTRMGETFASRVAASLLRAIGLPELITTSEPAYEALAIELAHNTERLRDLRERLNRNRLTSPLFDTAAFTRHIESAYTAIYARHLANLPPTHIHIPRFVRSINT